MIFTKLKLEDFLSFHELDYDFVLKPLMIVGENRTEDDQETNGTGKSSISTALEIALLMQNSRGVKTKNIIRRGTKVAKVELDIYCPVRQETLKIKRELRGAGSKLELEVNGDPNNIKFSTVPDGNAKILEWLSMNKEDISLYFLINRERFKSIFEAKASDKVGLINRFSDASIIDGVDDLVKLDIKKLEGEISSIDKKKSELIGQQSLIDEEIQKERARDVTKEMESEKAKFTEKINENSAAIARYESHIETVKEDIVKIETSISISEKIVSDAIAKVDAIVEVSFQNEYRELDDEKTNLSNNRREVNESIQEYQTLSRDVNAEIVRANNILAGAIKCPKCGHEFVLKENVDLDIEREVVEESNKTLVVINQTIEQLNGKNSELWNKIQELGEKMSEISAKERKQNDANNALKRALNDAQNNVSKLENQKASLENNISQSESMIEKCKNTITSLNSSIDSLKVAKIDIAGKQRQLEEIGKEIAKRDEEISKIEDELFEIKQWVVNFKRFKIELSNASLGVIENYWNKFLEDMRSNMRVHVEGFKILADNSEKEEVTVYVERDGVITDFGDFSGGEKARLIMASILSVRHMINSSNEYGGLNFLSIDEILNESDPLGISNMMSSIKDMESTIMVVTQIIGRDAGDGVLKVIKEKGISRVEV